MMNRLKGALLLLFFILFISTNGFAKQRTSDDALGIANVFFQKQLNTVPRNLSGVTSVNKLAYTCVEKVTTRSSDQKAYYYVFNSGENNGFVIVSGDDRAKNILGYSDSGSFSTKNMPDNFRNWLAFYEKELKALAETTEDTTITYASSITNLRTATTDAFATSINPLLGTIKWDQSTPYNIFCPKFGEIQSPTGCVATAMAQVMKYYQWPVTGTGTKTYKPNDQVDFQTADFSRTSYDWTNMPNIYDGNNTPIQDTAVATLMYQCGVAVSMDYSATSSGAFTNDIPAALSTYFGYDENAQLYTRNYYNEAEWMEKIKTELNANRPILYGGASSEGAGHQFVCDGYDSNNLFHFNWGWSGTCNGYFELTSLNVNTPGIGGGTGGYSVGQDMVTGIQKPTNTSTKTYQIFLLKDLAANNISIPRDSVFNMNYGFANYGGNTFDGEIALGLYQGDSLVLKLDETPMQNLLAYYGDANHTTNTLSVPSTVTDGTYQLYSIYKATNQSSWTVMRNKVGMPNSLNVTITSARISFSTPDVYPKLTLTEPIKVIGNLYKDKIARFSATIQNTGSEYNSYLLFQLCSALDGKMLQNLNVDPITIPAGTTKTIELTGHINQDPGNYTLNVSFDSNNNQDNYSIVLLNPLTNNSINVTVVDAPTLAPALTVTEKISLASNTISQGSETILTAKVKNNGGYFNNSLIAFIFEPIGQYSIDYMGPISLIIDTDEEKAVSFYSNMDLEEGSYFVKLYSASDNGWNPFTPDLFSKVEFTVTKTTGMEKSTTDKLHIYPNPATDILHVQSTSTIKSISILDVFGKQILKQEPHTTGTVPVSIINLSNGLYLIQTETEEGTYTEKFLKL